MDAQLDNLTTAGPSTLATEFDWLVVCDVAPARRPFCLGLGIFMPRGLVPSIDSACYLVASEHCRSSSRHSFEFVSPPRRPRCFVSDRRLQIGPPHFPVDKDRQSPSDRGSDKTLTMKAALLLLLLFQSGLCNGWVSPGKSSLRRGTPLYQSNDYNVVFRPSTGKFLQYAASLLTPPSTATSTHRDGCIRFLQVGDRACPQVCSH